MVYCEHMKSTQKLILGIDGGGTKTEMVLANEQEKILARIITGPTNIHTVSKTDAIRALKKGKVELYKKAKISSSKKLHAVGAGFAGIDSHQDQLKANAIVAKSLGVLVPKNKYLHVVNDTIIGFWSGTTKGEGICVIGGTGSNAYAVNAKGKIAWAGGLDWKMADEGSGFEQGWKAMRAAAKSADGRGKKTILEKMILQHHGVKSIRDLLPIVYGRKEYGKHEFGKLALLVEKAAIKGDAVAKQIANESADELVLLGASVARQLTFSKQKQFDLVMIGGVLQKDPIVNKRFKREFKKLYPKAVMIVPTVKPVMGAIRLAIHSL